MLCREGHEISLTGDISWSIVTISLVEFSTGEFRAKQV